MILKFAISRFRPQAIYILPNLILAVVVQSVGYATRADKSIFSGLVLAKQTTLSSGKHCLLFKQALSAQLGLIL